MNTKRLAIFLLLATGLFLIPLVAMQFTSEVNWTVSDFAMGGFLLFSTAIALELLLRTTNKPQYRAAIICVVLIILFLVWADLAVGIFGTPISGH